MNEPIGIKVPITMGKTGFFDQTFTSLEEAKSNLLNLILTNKGERPMQPDFGTDIYNKLFEQSSVDVGSLVQHEIEEQVEFWLPYVELTEVKVDASAENIDRNRIGVVIGFSLKRDLKLYDELIIEFVI